MGRNKLIYALSDVTVVISSADGSGGTWTGAIEALRGGWVPVLVRNEPGAPAGNRALIAQGATPIGPEALEGVVTSTSLRELAGQQSRVTDTTGPDQQPGMFD
jgi:predicted Rossmann fold nucleotide-binding protein DprA/Smf involved in DNA uptake